MSTSRGAARRSLVPSFLSHRSLLLTESVLLLGLIEILGRQWLMAEPGIHPVLRVLLGMILVVGLFGGVLLLVRRQIYRTLQATHDTVRRVPLPTQPFALHILALLVLFYAYAWAWGLDQAVLRSLPVP